MIGGGCVGSFGYALTFGFTAARALASIMQGGTPYALRAAPLALFREHLVGPGDQADEDGRVGEGRVLAGQVCLEDPTGPRAGASNVDGDLVLERLGHGFGQGRPAHGHDGAGHGRPHERHRLAQQEDLHRVAGAAKAFLIGNLGFWIEKIPLSIPGGLILLLRRDPSLHAVTRADLERVRREAQAGSVAT